MSRLNMRGSVASFVVVGVVLAALVLGSIYVVKTQLAGKLQDDKTQVAVNTAEEAVDDVIGEDKNDQKSSEEAAKTEKSKEDETARAQVEKDKAEQRAAEKEAANEKTKAAADAKAEDERAAEARAEAQSSSETATENKETTMPTTGVNQQAAAQAEELPETGPTETLMSMVVFGSLAGIIVAYRRSARAKA